MIYIFYLVVCLYTDLYKFNLLPNVCLCLLLPNVTNSEAYCLRNVDEFAIPLFRTSLEKKCSKVCGPKYWNSLLKEIINFGLSSEHCFQSKLRYSLINKYLAE
jgi:hypothetical protein